MRIFWLYRRSSGPPPLILSTTLSIRLILPFLGIRPLSHPALVLNEQIFDTPKCIWLPFLKLHQRNYIVNSRSMIIVPAVGFGPAPKPMINNSHREYFVARCTKACTDIKYLWNEYTKEFSHTDRGWKRNNSNHPASRSAHKHNSPTDRRHSTLCCEDGTARVRTQLPD
jgi:hypothetical protein